MAGAGNRTGAAMLNLRNLDETFAASGQIGAVDVAEAISKGYTTIINNRPDSEIPADQPTSAENRKAAEAAGGTYYYLPMTPDTLSRNLIEAFAKALDNAPGPVLAHCGTGMRSTALWVLVQCVHKDRDIDEALNLAAERGYDLSALRPVIEKQRAAHAAGD